MNKSPLKLLIIDDDESFIERITTLFVKDFHCVTASSALRGIRLFEQDRTGTCLVLCDINLPDLTGFDVCSTIKSQSPKTPVYLLSGYNSSELRITALHAYADAFFNKSMHDNELKLQVRNATNTIRPSASINRPTLKNINSQRDSITNFESELVDYVAAYFEKPIEARYKSYLSVIVIAKHFNMSDRTFQRKIREHTGCTYTHYISNIKINKSKDFLAAGFSVSQITELLEYSSPSHYSREFKKHVDMTPNRYRISIQALIS